MEVRLGNIFGYTGGNYAGNVYDQNFMCPTLNTMQGGGKQPMIIENIPCATSRVNKGEFVSSQDLKLINVGQEEAGTILSRYWKGIEGDHSNAIIVAMRGRNPDNPSDRTVGSPTEQRLELNSQGICNTLTSVQKDNLVMEVMQLGFMDNGTGQHQSNTVYDENALCPNITTIEGGGTQQIKVMTETVHIKQATSQGYIECEVGGVADLSFPDSNTRRGRVQENGQVFPTLMAGEQDICRIKKLGRISCDGSQCGTVISENGISANLVAGTHGYANHHICTQYRIRKLTPLECWRLMDFTDEDFEKAAQVNSNTQLYKQAGNSIVRNVLVAILGQMIPGKENVYRQ